MTFVRSKAAIEKFMNTHTEKVAAKVDAALRESKSNDLPEPERSNEIVDILLAEELGANQNLPQEYKDLVRVVVGTMDEPDDDGMYSLMVGWNWIRSPFIEIDPLSDY